MSTTQRTVTVLTARPIPSPLHATGLDQIVAPEPRVSRGKILFWVATSFLALDAVLLTIALFVS